LLQGRKALEKFELKGDEQHGVQVLQRVPGNALPHDCRECPASMHGGVHNIRKSKEKNYGYNRDTGDYGDLRKAGASIREGDAPAHFKMPPALPALLLDHRIFGRRSAGKEEERRRWPR